MKINLLAVLALVGQVSAEEGHGAAEGGHGGEIKWFWRAEEAAASRAREQIDWPENNEGGVIMSACFGLQSCNGFQNDGRDLIYSARQWKCNVKSVRVAVRGNEDRTSATSLANLNKLCPGIKPINQLDRPYDAMPTTFNFPVEYDSLDITGADFVIERSDGSFTRPICAFLDPAAESNELHTVSLLGHFGGRDENQWPRSIRVVGDLKLYNNEKHKVISAQGLQLKRSDGGDGWVVGNAQYGHSMSYESGLVMLKAWAYEFTELGEQDNNHCQLDFPLTTHVIKILFNGGMTKDGLRPLLPTDRDLFTVLKARGEVLLSNKFLGLADLGNGDSYRELPDIYETDGDNYLDLCIRMLPGDNIENLLFVSIQERAVTPPRGTGPNEAHTVRITHLNPSQYPYKRPVTTLQYKLALKIFVALTDEVATVVLGVLSFLGVPFAGFLLAATLIAAQPFIPPLL